MPIKCIQSILVGLANLRLDDFLNVLNGAQLRLPRYGAGHLLSAPHNFLIEYFLAFAHDDRAIARLYGNFWKDYFRLRYRERKILVYIYEMNIILKLIKRFQILCPIQVPSYVSSELSSHYLHFKMKQNHLDACFN